MKDFTPTLYLRLRKKIQLPQGAVVYLGQIAQLLVDPELESQLNNLVIHTPAESDGHLFIVDMLQIVQRVRQVMPQLNVEVFGDPQAIVELVKPVKAKPNMLLLAVACLLLFVGSGLAIMNFHSDVSMMEVHQKLYTLITGEEVQHPLLLQVPYSIGLGAGMMIFFNRVFRKKFNEEPNPLEVEMNKYQESLNQYVITEEYRKQHRTDSS